MLLTLGLIPSTENKTKQNQQKSMTKTKQKQSKEKNIYECLVSED
jgi:hypothetical protein